MMMNSNNIFMEKSVRAGKYFYKHIYKNFLLISLVCFLLCVTIICSQYYMLLVDRTRSSSTLELDYVHANITRKTEIAIDSCLGRYIYMHDLSSRFNSGILKNCSSLNKWSDMCPFVSNMGLGMPVSNSFGILNTTSWFSTNQFSLEIIFHQKMRKYKCLTKNSSLASAIYVPFYSGLDVGRYLWADNNTLKDAASLDLVNFLVGQPEWKYMYGKDHFFTNGRITWDFRRPSDEDTDWGNKLFLLPETKNMTVLTIEASLWENNEFAIPYPTYFHPSSKEEITEWQKFILKQKRDNLFTFLGGPRAKSENFIREKIISQCLNASKCSFLDCSDGSVNCNEPGEVMKVFLNATFCLQPQGDSYTRRSTFDSILAGCIPVFFHPESAYKQYKWHLPAEYIKYSVFIPEDSFRDGEADIEKTLLDISEFEVLAMRKEVSRLIPKVIYNSPKYSTDGSVVEDAFDIVVKRVLERVKRIRKEMKGNKTDVSFSDIYEVYF